MRDSGRWFAEKSLPEHSDYKATTSSASLSFCVGRHPTFQPFARAFSTFKTMTLKGTRTPQDGSTPGNDPTGD
jgi:hypothetical protein